MWFKQIFFLVLALNIGMHATDNNQSQVLNALEALQKSLGDSMDRQKLGALNDYLKRDYSSKSLSNVRGQLEGFRESRASKSAKGANIVQLVDAAQAQIDVDLTKERKAQEQKMAALETKFQSEPQNKDKIFNALTEFKKSLVDGMDRMKVDALASFLQKDYNRKNLAEVRDQLNSFRESKINNKGKKMSANQAIDSLQKEMSQNLDMA